MKEKRTTKKFGERVVKYIYKKKISDPFIIVSEQRLKHHFSVNY